MSQLDDVAQLRPWLRLLQTEGVGNQTGRVLLTAFGMPEAIFSASYAQLTALVSPRVARALLQPPSAAQQNQFERTLAWLAQPGHRIVTLADADYPPALLQIADPPLLLYLKGRAELLPLSALAVVGSRNATIQGVLNAERFSEAVSRAGISVISGLALGIDAAAHRGGLRGSGASVAVIGTGIDIDYPASNRSLARQLAQEGCIVSEYQLGTPPQAGNFPRRNRLISGLAHAVLVVEAAARSGSLITANIALEQGRDVMAIPGSIHSPLSKGCHFLIKQGAKLVESVDDILQEFQRFQSAPSTLTPAHPLLDQTGKRVMQALGFDPVDADSLSQSSGLAPAQLHAQLLQLELDGLIESLPGARYRRLD